MFIVKRRFVNAGEEALKSFFKTSLLCLAAGALTAVFSAQTAEMTTGSAKAFLPVLAAGVLFILLPPQCVLQGFFEGLGAQYSTENYSMAADVIRIITGTVLGGVLAYLAYGYGEKVDALLLASDNRYIYAAFGAMCGVALGNLLALLFLIIVRIRFHVQWKNLIDASEGKRGSAPSLLRGALPVSLAVVLPLAGLIVMTAVYVRFEGLSEGGNVFLPLGITDSHFMTLMVFAGIISVLPQLKEIFRTGSLAARTEREKTAFRYLGILHRICVTAFPVSAILMALSDPLPGILFKTGSSDGALMLSYGSYTLSFLALFVMATILLQLMRKYNRLLISDAAGCLAGIGFSAILAAAGRGVHIIPAGALVTFAVYSLCGCIMLARSLNLHRLVVMQVFLIPLLCSALSGLIAMLVSRGVMSGAGDIAAIGSGAVCGIVLYLVFILVAGGLSDAEASSIPFGMALKSWGAKVIMSLTKRGKPQ